MMLSAAADIWLQLICPDNNSYQHSFLHTKMRHICYKFVDCQGPVKTYLKNILFCTSPTIPSEGWLWPAVQDWLFKGHFHGMVYIMGSDFYQEYIAVNNF